MHIHIGRVYKITLIISVILLMVLGLFVVKTTTHSSLESKQSSVITSVSEINNKLQTINTASLYPGSSSGGDFIINQVGETKTMIQEFDYPSASAFESLFHDDTATELNKLNKQAREANNGLSGQLNSFSDNVETLIKFIEYSPTEDFAQLGQDANNDVERIDRAIKAFNELSSNQAISEDYSNQLLLAVVAATKFKQITDLTSFSEIIGDIQKEIIAKISNDVEQLKTTYNEQYELIIYQ